MSVKNGYVSLNANADEKKIQNAGIFYNADNQSAYINFVFNDSINLSNISNGFTIINIDDNTLELELNFVEATNQAFIVIPPEYLSQTKPMYGEVYLRYPQNTMMVGKFKTEVLDTLANVRAEEVANAYVPKYEDIQNKYNDLKRQFEELGLGTFEDAVRKVNKVLAKDEQIYPALKGLAEQDKTKLTDADALNLPPGVYECVGLQNAPENMAGHVVHALTMGGENAKRQTILIDNDTGEMFYRVFDEKDQANLGARAGWMRVASEVVLYHNAYGERFTEPVQLNQSLRIFNTVRIRAYNAKRDLVFYSGVVRDGDWKATLTITSLWDDGQGITFLEGDLWFIDKGTKAQLRNPRRIVLHSDGHWEVSNDIDVRIVDICGIM